jgi:hypothetical protein
LGLWITVEWETFWDKGKECDEVVRKMLKRMKRIAPDYQFRYCRRRFLGSGKEGIVMSGLENISDWDQFQVDLGKDEEFMELNRAWHSCIGNSNRPTFWEEKFTVK